MIVYMNRSLLPLRKDTMAAWNEGAANVEVDIVWLRRHRDKLWSPGVDKRKGPAVVINLGLVDLSLIDTSDVVVINHPSVVRKVANVQQCYEVMSVVMPLPGPRTNDFWCKGNGYRGNNKFRIEGTYEDHMCNGRRIHQAHVNGREFRVITVNETVVQVMERKAPGVLEWLGVNRAAKIDGVIPLAKRAASLLGPEPTIIGWDIIRGKNKEAYLLEGNSCPGVNAATATRIFKELKEQYNG